MKKKDVFWIPRILAIIHILFISLFSLDVFGEYAFPEVLLALFMHLIPTFIFIALLVIAWRWPKIGGWLYIIIGLFSIYFFRAYKNIVTFLIMPFPLILIGILFARGIKMFFKKKIEKLKKQNDFILMSTLWAKGLGGLGIGFLIAGYYQGNWVLVGWITVAVAFIIAAPVYKVMFFK